MNGCDFQSAKYVTEQINCFPPQTANLHRATNGEKTTLTGVVRVVQSNWRDKYLLRTKAEVYYQVQVGEQRLWIEHNEMSNLAFSIPEEMSVVCLQLLVASQCR
ncbi:hypothetical protein FX995_17410 [Pseudoalteromonas flavipulchra]|nr:hypothetical protein QT15_12800 [Pseudoalteromonas flavipulchra NCIMB 2033 = ATCC BAA-314]MBD0783454.1 hypothetical protein [Pseudoalteromonas flavipulchra]